MAHALDPYIAEWERGAAGRAAGGPLAPLREEAFRQFLALGFPTTRDEEWRFTSVAPIAERTFMLARRPAGAGSLDVAELALPVDPAAELVFVDGQYAPALSRAGALPPGVRAGSLASALASGNGVVGHLGRVASIAHRPFVALNTAFLDDGAVVEIPAGAVVAQPIHLLFVATGSGEARPPMAHPRMLLVLGANSQAAVIETYAGPAGEPYFTNAVTEVALGENAVLEHYKLQHEGADAFHIGAIHVNAGRSASYASYAISLGGGLVRNDIAAVLDGEGASCALYGLYTADAQRFVDNHTTIDHARPHCGSREIYKGILADRARGVFNGKIIVRPDAQKTDARQTNRALLLSGDAQINTKPQLEIFANDVKCTHGAAVGQLDEDALFYLRSRGLAEASARRMLIQAFASDVLGHLPLEPIRARVGERLQRQLARALPAAA
ncbi:MAG: Fe-S cluster assembly protein SufD [Acidobacteria bacterium]|nr:Fe-S cluster assembly protein SufD [Acidobacteriota bacterium]